MRLPFCQFCKGRSVLTTEPGGVFTLRCKACPHGVVGHASVEKAIKAFLWKHCDGTGSAIRSLACGCPESGCVHPMFEVVDKLNEAG